MPPRDEEHREIDDRQDDRRRSRREPEGSRMYLEAGEPNEGNPGARQPSSASVYSTSNPSRNSLAARLDPSA